MNSEWSPKASINVLVIVEQYALKMAGKALLGMASKPTEEHLILLQ